MLHRPSLSSIPKLSSKWVHTRARTCTRKRTLVRARKREMREREDGIEGEMERTKTRDSEQSSERAEDGKKGEMDM